MGYKIGDRVENNPEKWKNNSRYRSNTCLKCGAEDWLIVIRKSGPRAGTEERRCRPCSNSTKRKWFKNNPEKVAEQKKASRPAGKRRLIRSYGISVEDFHRMFDTQDGKCAICRREETKKITGSDTTRDLCIDHCHSTNKVRGLLCYKCNLAIAHFDDNVEILKSAIAYLNKEDTSDE